MGMSLAFHIIFAVIGIAMPLLMAVLCDLAKQGVAILMISSDLPEILAMSDRILVMRRGRITAELSAQLATQEAIMHYATG